MGEVVFFLVLSGALLAVFFPWIGIIDGYTSILLGPHVLWWWSFTNHNHFLYISVGTSAGIILFALRGRIKYKYLLNIQNFFLLGWLTFIIFSYLWGPYIKYEATQGFFSPNFVFPIIIKSFFFYFLSILCINKVDIFKYFCCVIIFTSVFFIFWINKEYLSGSIGRIGGPVGLNATQYGDENNFAMFFVISMPFLYNIKTFFKNKLICNFIFLTIPLGWHAVFLTGSRGGFLSLFFITALNFIKSTNKKLSFLLFILFLAMIYFQGGSTLKDRLTIYADKSTVEESAQGRFNSWIAASKMIASHPFTGVGVSSFGAAFPFFSDKPPLEAHNTFLQIGAESGIFALTFYLCFLVTTLRKLYNIISTPFKGHDNNIHCMHLERVAKLIFLSWTGFAFCAFFLSLQIFEQFFYLAIISNYVITNTKQHNIKPSSLDTYNPNAT